MLLFLSAHKPEMEIHLLLFSRAVITLALVRSTIAHGSKAEVLNAKIFADSSDTIKTLFDQRVSSLSNNRQSTAALVPCRPDAFPLLTIAGFCSDIGNLDILCLDLEISVSSVGCSSFAGRFCCYRSFAQGNTNTFPTTTAPTSASTSTRSTLAPTVPPTTARSTPAPTAAPTAAPTVVTTVAPSTTSLAPQCSRLLDTSCPNVQQLILTLINNVRRQQQAANMLEMQWDATAAQVAQDWANQCRNVHGPDTRPTSLFDSSGQNIANGDGIQSWNFTFQLWDQEAELFTIGQSPCVNFEQIGHFTQDVWATTFQIGCGFAPCPNSVGNFFVCNYGPPGNSGDLCSPYLFGNSANGGVCGKCGGINSASCNNGLCRNPCPFQNVYSNCDTPVASNPDTFPALIPNTSKCITQPNDAFVLACPASCKCRDQGLIY